MNDERLAELQAKYKNRNLLEELRWGIYWNHSGYTSKQNGEFLNWLCLMAYKSLKERSQGKWIPVSERLPDNEKEVLIQYGQSMVVGYHMLDSTVYPPEFEDENETGWYGSDDNFICGSDEVIAWQSLPEPYMKGGAE